MEYKVFFLYNILRNKFLLKFIYILLLFQIQDFNSQLRIYCLLLSLFYNFNTINFEYYFYNNKTDKNHRHA